MCNELHSKSYCLYIVPSLSSKMLCNSTIQYNSFLQLKNFFSVKPGFHIIVKVGHASPRQAQGHIWDSYVKWKHILLLIIYSSQRLVWFPYDRNGDRFHMLPIDRGHVDDVSQFQFSLNRQSILNTILNKLRYN